MREIVMKFFGTEVFHDDPSRDDPVVIRRACAEYAAYMHDIWDRLPRGLRAIQRHMLPAEEFADGAEWISLHDGQMEKIVLDRRSATLQITWKVDLHGDLAFVKLTYGDVTEWKVSKSFRMEDDPNEDLMRHEVEAIGDDFVHRLQFADNNIIVIICKTCDIERRLEG